MAGFCGGPEPTRCCRKKSCETEAGETQEVKLSGPQTSAACNMHTGGSSSQESLEFVSISLSPPTLVANTTMLRTGVQPLRWGDQARSDELNMKKWILLCLGLWSQVRISRLPCSPQRVETLLFCPAWRLERFLREWTAAEAPPRGQHPPPVESFAAFLYAFLINPKLLTKVCN